MLKFICSDKEFKKEFAKSFKDYEIKVKKDKYVMEYYNEEESSKEDIFENIYESLKTCRKVKNALEEINMFEIRMEEYKEGQFEDESDAKDFVNMKEMSIIFSNDAYRESKEESTL